MIELKRLRQIALMTSNLEQSLAFWQEAFGLEECFRDDLSGFGLVNVLLPVGDTFLELLQPADPHSSGARYLERHGESLYMTIFEAAVDDAAERYLEAQAIPVVHRIDRSRWRGVHLHPKAMNRLLISVEDARAPDEPGRWPAAGEAWRPHVRTEVVSAIHGAIFITGSLDCDVGRWHRLFGGMPSRYFTQDGARIAPVPIGDTAIEFLQPLEPGCAAERYLDRHGPGMYVLMLDTPDLDAAMVRVQRHGVRVVRVDESPDGSRSAWLHPKGMHGVLTELIERR